jgi:hypothetical protein
MDWNLHHEGDASFQHMYPGPVDTDGLHDLITNYGYYFPDYKFPLRFLENHDETRYISENTVAETKQAAALLFAMPGVPQVYAGQEVGETSQRGHINWNADPHGMEEHFYRLAQTRAYFPSLRTDELNRLEATQSNSVYAFSRYEEDEWPVLSINNTSPGVIGTTVQVPVEELGIDPDGIYYLNNVIDASSEEVMGSDIEELSLVLMGYESRMYVVADSVVIFDVPERDREAATPLTWELGNNYPNPFNPVTTIDFQVPRAAHVKVAVYNVLGQRVRTLIDQPLNAGRHSLFFDGRDSRGQVLSSGVYFYRMEAGPFARTRKMILMK